MWIVMPVMAGPEMTEAAISDCLAQTVPTQILVINQGVETAFRDRLERLVEAQPDRIFLWSHDPPLLSLSASWNRALDFIWSLGETEAFVVNNDVRLHTRTVEVLKLYLDDEQALFVSAVGVTQEQFDAAEPTGIPSLADGSRLTSKGGPDFSCFLISHVCHTQWRFDEQFIPAFCEDLDYHRRLMLAGYGGKIFSVNLPYLHLASQTLKQVSDGKRAQIGRAIEAGSRAHYLKKWGGPVNAETFFSPFDRGIEGISTAGLPNPPTSPALQEYFARPRPS